MADVEQHPPITSDAPGQTEILVGEITERTSTNVVSQEGPVQTILDKQPTLIQHQNSIGSMGAPDSPMTPDPVHDLPEELLQIGWRKFWSRREQRPYFFNKITNESLWEMPQLLAVSRFNAQPLTLKYTASIFVPKMLSALYYCYI